MYINTYTVAAAAAKSLQSCPTLCDPHRRQPTRLPHPWDSPGKNTGVGCHFLLQCMKVKSESQVAQSCPTLSDPMDCSPPGSSIHRIFQARLLEWGAIAFSIYIMTSLDEPLKISKLNCRYPKKFFFSSQKLLIFPDKSIFPLAYAYTTNLEKAMAHHSSTLAWKILWMEEPGGLQSMGSLRVGHD